MTLDVVTPPTVEPVALSLAKAHLRVVQNDEDALITHYLIAARQHVERTVSVALITQQLRVTFADGGHGRRLPRRPVQAVDAIETETPDGWIPIPAGTTTTSDAWLRCACDWCGGLHGSGRLKGPVRVTFTAGYGDTPETVPEHFTDAILKLTALFYQDREPAAAPNFQRMDIQQIVEGLLSVEVAPAIGI